MAAGLACASRGGGGGAAGLVPVLFCTYDAPLPPPLWAVRRTTVPFATAMVLLPEPGTSARAALGLRFGTDGAPRGGGLDAQPAGDAASPLSDRPLERIAGRSEGSGASAEPRPTVRSHMAAADRVRTGTRSATDSQAAEDPLDMFVASDPLDALAAENPAARALPLLRALAARRAATLFIPMFGNSLLEIEVAP